MSNDKAAQQVLATFPNDMNISQSQFKGLESVVLENKHLRAEWVPIYGGKMVSLIVKTSGDHELLYQTPLTKLVCPNYGADFGSYDTSGFDECFPSIEACSIDIEEQGVIKTVSIPDHGDVWSLQWEYGIDSDGCVEFYVTSPLLPYRMTKRLVLEKNELVIDYKVELTGTVTKMPFLWTPHALFSYQNDTKLLFPKHLNTITSVCPVGRLQDITKTYVYPKHTLDDGKSWDGSLFEKHDEGLCEKFYFNLKLSSEDWFGFQDSRCRLMMNVDSTIAPYLGIWKNQGGHNRTHNFALEPCSGIYDSAEKAQRNGTVAYVTSKKPVTWSLKFKID